MGVDDEVVLVDGKLLVLLELSVVEDDLPSVVIRLEMVVEDDEGETVSEVAKSTVDVVGTIEAELGAVESCDVEIASDVITPVIIAELLVNDDEETSSEAVESIDDVETVEVGLAAVDPCDVEDFVFDVLSVLSLGYDDVVVGLCDFASVISTLLLVIEGSVEVSGLSDVETVVSLDVVKVLGAKVELSVVEPAASEMDSSVELGLEVTELVELGTVASVLDSVFDGKLDIGLEVDSGSFELETSAISDVVNELDSSELSEDAADVFEDVSAFEDVMT